ncbi:hypothetical protein D4764_04G0004200 [Takifugu flavidus]|uniref:Uncharacterized protein n=1 Tax=Takifugu flavidus TaxID=433684 RepID=A0A5C6N3L8_9TELE|nr:hypothetical protein D4764_04G0004200 [Takifugu flavidus]
MSWLLAVWISLGFLLFCQATLYQTIQQHHVARPGHTDILTLGYNREAAVWRPEPLKAPPDINVHVGMEAPLAVGTVQELLTH